MNYKEREREREREERERERESIKYLNFNKIISNISD